MKELANVKDSDRTARYYCALAFALPGKKTITVNGACEGIITNERKGTNGFGYDPFFYVPSIGKTMAEISPEEKNRMSHRAIALRKLEAQLSQILSTEKQV